MTKTKDLYKEMYEHQKQLVANIKAELQEARKKEKCGNACVALAVKVRYASTAGS